MSDYEVGNDVAYEKLEENVVDWAYGCGDVELEEYLQILMRSEDSDSAVSYNLQMIGLELGYQSGDEELADSLFERILEADETRDEQVFGISPERAEKAFYDRGFRTAKQMKD